MIQIFFLILSFFSFFIVESQNKDDAEIVEDTSISNQLYTKCFANLNQGNEIFEKYPTFKSDVFCSLFTCSVLLAYKETDLQIAGEKRLIGIATQLFKEGNPVYLVSGLDSSYNSNKENENLEDENHLVYISYGECLSPIYLIRAADIVNRQTHFLINQSANK